MFVWYGSVSKKTQTFVHWADKYQSPPDHICISTFFPETPGFVLASF